MISTSINSEHDKIVKIHGKRRRGVKHEVKNIVYYLRGAC